MATIFCKGGVIYYCTFFVKTRWCHWNSNNSTRWKWSHYMAKRINTISTITILLHHCLLVLSLLFSYHTVLPLLKCMLYVLGNNKLQSAFAVCSFAFVLFAVIIVIILCYSNVAVDIITIARLHFNILLIWIVTRFQTKMTLYKLRFTWLWVDTCTKYTATLIYHQISDWLLHVRKWFFHYFAILLITFSTILHLMLSLLALPLL